MKTLLTSVLGLAAMTSVALAGEPVSLTESQMDTVTAGAASVSWTVSGTAAGPNNASTTSEATGAAVTVGGLSPFNAAALSGSLTANSD
jgi:hypothetical protein